MGGKSGMDEETTLNYSEALLEFRFADAIDKVTRKEFPIVAYLAGNGEPLPPNPIVKDLFVTMSSNYRFGVIDLKNGRLDADTVNAIMIVKPSQLFTETEKLKIDQYVMHGGKVIWFVDKLYAEMDSLLRVQSDFVAYDKNLNLDDILFKYGVRINGDLLQDLKSAKQPLVVGQMGNQPQIERLPFPYYPLLSSPSTHPIAKNMDDVLSIFPGSIDTVKAPGIKKTVLLASDTNSRTLSTPAIVSLQSVKNENDLRTFNKSYIPVAVLLEGKFTSLFANRLTNELKDSLSIFSNKPFIQAGDKEGKQVVVSDGDIVTNVVTQSEGALPMGVQQYENYPFANKEFLLNAVEYLVNPNGVLESRSKDFTLRLLDKQKVMTEKTKWQVINIGLPIFLVMLFGWVYQLRRRKYFTA
jgi:gliding-associated putative ABC transporter substrate-binding component GldG